MVHTLPFDAASMFSVKGKVALITGGGSGLGQVFAETLAINGAARVYIVGRRKEALEKVVSHYNNNKKDGQGEIVALPGDVSTKDSIMKIVEAWKARGETKLDILINSAGVMKGTVNADPKDAESMTKNMWDFAEEDWKLMYDVNVISLWYMTAAFLPYLQRTHEEHLKPDFDSPSVLNVASIAGLQYTRTAVPGYQSSKAAVLHLTNVMMTRLLPHHVRVNALAPGLFPSEMTASPEEVEEKFKDTARTTIPSQRAGQLHEIAGPALMLCSRAGGFINGSSLTVDGGRLRVVSGALGGSVY